MKVGAARTARRGSPTIATDADADADVASPTPPNHLERWRMARMLRHDEGTRQLFRRGELLRRLELHPLQVVSFRRLHVPVDGYRLDLDGASLDLRLLWTPAGTPVRLSALRWREGLAWELRIVDARGEALHWYAWSLRIR